MNIQRINPTSRWSDATIYNGLIHFVEVPEDTAVDMAAQVRQIFAQAEATLAQCQSDKSRLISATIYITDIADMPVLNREWEAWLPAGCAPSRACLKVELLNPAMRVEIAFVAAEMRVL